MEIRNYLSYIYIYILIAVLVTLPYSLLPYPTLVQEDLNKVEWRRRELWVGLLEMKVYYGKKVHTRPFHALLKKLRPQGRLARYRIGEGRGLWFPIQILLSWKTQA
jgi:hypothetical protein